MNFSWNLTLPWHGARFNMPRKIIQIKTCHTDYVLFIHNIEGHDVCAVCLGEVIGYGRRNTKPEFY